MADEHDLAARLVMAFGFHMDLGDKRAGGVEIDETPMLGFPGHGFRYAVSRKDDGHALGHGVQLLDEAGAHGLQALDNEAVVNDLVAHIDRRAVFLERALDDLHGALDAGAKAARRRKQES